MRWFEVEQMADGPRRATFNTVIYHRKFRVADWFLINLYALIHAQQVRRSVEPGAITCGLDNAGKCRGG